MVLVINTGLPVQSVEQLVDFAKAHPNEITYAAPVGAPQHLAAELFRQTTGAPIMHIPYKVEGPAVTDLVGGQIKMMFSFPVVVASFVKAGRLRALAVTLDKRIPAMPDTPSVREIGMRPLELSSWGAFFAPPGTARPIVDRLNSEIVRIMNNTEIIGIYHSFGADPISSTPEQQASFIATERMRWAKVLDRANIRIEQ